jgi:hypothetical protein
LGTGKENCVVTKRVHGRWRRVNPDFETEEKENLGEISGGLSKNIQLIKKPSRKMAFLFLKRMIV